MPVYEYRCRNCNHQFEIQQAMSDDALKDCPSCGEPQLRKVFQPVGISFKGSGFYKNDSRSSSSPAGKQSAGGSSSGSSTSESNGKASGDSKSGESGSGGDSGSGTDSSGSSSSDSPGASTKVDSGTSS